MVVANFKVLQGTIMTGMFAADGRHFAAEVLPWADPYIAMLVERHRLQMTLFAAPDDSFDWPLLRAPTPANGPALS